MQNSLPLVGSRLGLLLTVTALLGCAAETKPEDVVLAEELCFKRGGFLHVARYERGALIDIRCKDGTQLEARPPKKVN